MNNKITGYWITAEGVIYECTWKQDHDFVAPMVGDYLQSEALAAGWIRITFLEGFAIDLPSCMTPNLKRVFMGLVKDLMFEHSDPWVSLANDRFGSTMNRLALVKAVSLI